MVAPKWALFPHITTTPDRLLTVPLGTHVPSMCSSATLRGCRFFLHGCRMVAPPPGIASVFKIARRRSGGRRVLFCSPHRPPFPCYLCGVTFSEICQHPTGQQYVTGPLPTREPGKDCFGCTRGCQEPKQGRVVKERSHGCGRPGRASRVGRMDPQALLIEVGGCFSL